MSVATVAVVTGAGRGIGREITALLAAAGHIVLATDVDESVLAQTRSAIPGRIETARLDVRRPDDHRAVARHAEELGRLTVWINNAGIMQTGEAVAQPDDVVERMVAINLLGVMHGSRAAVEVMRRHGRPCDIINISSLSAFGPVPGLAVYGATKAAVLSWTTSMAYEMRSAGSPVRLHALCPDAARTSLLMDNAHDAGSRLIFSAPRLLDAGEVARAAVALLGSRQLVRTLPAGRGLMVRISGLIPRAVGPALRILARIGDRRRQAESSR
jgi:NAD(P)-dependent dehydrogenase (short-subunit alcohol dehydrogenase family)